MQKNLTLPINIWLIALALIVLSMIAVGGLTRLTESGLSMVDWQLIMGVIPPLNQTDWLQLFEDYKLYPEYRIKNLNMSLDEFKYIFWWEYGHRVLGRLIGIIFLVPFIYFSFKIYCKCKIFTSDFAICNNFNDAFIVYLRLIINFCSQCSYFCFIGLN